MRRMNSLWKVALSHVVASHVAEVRLNGVRHFRSEVGKFNRLSAEFPLIPLVRFHDV